MSTLPTDIYGNDRFNYIISYTYRFNVVTDLTGIQYIFTHGIRDGVACYVSDSNFPHVGNISGTYYSGIQTTTTIGNVPIEFFAGSVIYVHIIFIDLQAVPATETRHQLAFNGEEGQDVTINYPTDIVEINNPDLTTVFPTS